MNITPGTRILLVYDPVHGEPIADGLAYEFVYSVIKSTEERLIYTATSLVVEYFRLAVFRKDLSPTELMIRFNDIDIFVTSDGRFTQYPKGFLDYVETILMELI